MERQAKLTSKGQVTIPIEVRRILGAKAGDRIIFECTDTGVKVTPVRKECALEKYRGIERKGKGRTIEEIVKELREFRGHDDGN